MLGCWLGKASSPLAQPVLLVVTGLKPPNSFQGFWLERYIMNTGDKLSKLVIRSYGPEGLYYRVEWELCQSLNAAADKVTKCRIRGGPLQLHPCTQHQAPELGGFQQEQCLRSCWADLNQLEEKSIVRQYISWENPQNSIVFYLPNIRSHTIRIPA